MSKLSIDPLSMQDVYLTKLALNNQRPRVVARFICSSTAMTIESAHPPITVPQVDLWEFLFEQPDREYPDEHGELEALCTF